jgi:hypothetical protein
LGAEWNVELSQAIAILSVALFMVIQKHEDTTKKSPHPFYFELNRILNLPLNRGRVSPKFIWEKHTSNLAGKEPSFLHWFG